MLTQVVQFEHQTSTPSSHSLSIFPLTRWRKPLSVLEWSAMMTDVPLCTMLSISYCDISPVNTLATDPQQIATFPITENKLRP